MLRGDHNAPDDFRIFCLEHDTNYQTIAVKLGVRPNQLLDSIRRDNTPGEVKLNNKAFALLREYEHALFNREPAIKKPISKKQTKYATHTRTDS